MATIHRITISPSSLELDGGPHSQPFGTLIATAWDGNNRAVSGGSFSWSSNNPSFTLQPDPSNPARVTVGSYQPGKAAITVREATSGKSAQAVVTVRIMDAGMPGGRTPASLSRLVASAVTHPGTSGVLCTGILPVGSSPAPRLKSYSLAAFPGEKVTLELRLAGPATHLLAGVSGMTGYYEMDLCGERSGARAEGEQIQLILQLAPSIDISSFNLDIGTRNGEEMGQHATQVFVQVKSSNTD